MIFRPWKMSGMSPKKAFSTEPCLFGRKSRSKLFQGGDGWFSCGCRFQGRAPWFLHAPTWLELFTFLSGPFPPIFRVFKHSVCFRECISYQPGKKHTNVKWVEHFPIQITFISLTSASAQVYYTTKVKNTTCQSQWHGWSLWLIAWEKRGFVYPPPLPTYISYIAVKLTKQGTSLSYTLGESNPQVLHSHTHTHHHQIDFANARNRFEVCNVHVALRCLIGATTSSFGGTVHESQTTTWHVWNPSQTMAFLPYQLVTFTGFLNHQQGDAPKTTNCYFQGL